MQASKPSLWRGGPAAAGRGGGAGVRSFQRTRVHLCKKKTRPFFFWARLSQLVFRAVGAHAPPLLALPRAHNPKQAPWFTIAPTLSWRTKARRTSMVRGLWFHLSCDAARSPSVYSLTSEKNITFARGQTRARSPFHYPDCNGNVSLPLNRGWASRIQAGKCPRGGRVLLARPARVTCAAKTPTGAA